jgi:hypothetical protein
MSPEMNIPETCATAEELRLIQNAIGDALRTSMDQFTQSELSDAIALTLIRLAFAEVLHGLVIEETQACEI